MATVAPRSAETSAKDCETGAIDVHGKEQLDAGALFVLKSKG